MAKNNKITQNNETIISKVKRKEFLVGLASVIVAIVLISNLFPRMALKKNQNTISNSRSKIISPIITTTAELKKTVLPSPTSIPNKIKEIKQLANTSGYYEEVVQEGDNFWKISKRVCGDGRYYLSIEKRNGYSNQTLQPGDVIKIDCSE